MVRISLLLTWALISTAQQTEVSGSGPAPIRKVHIDTSRPTPVNLPNTIISLLPRCRDGRCYSLFIVNPQKDFKENIEAFDLHGKVFSIDPASIPGLRYGAVLDLAPVEGGVAVLLHGEEQRGLPGTAKPAPAFLPMTGNSATQGSGYYLLVYDSDGKMKAIHRLELSSQPVRMAALPRGLLLMTGFDSKESKGVLATLEDDGSGVRFLDDKKVIPAPDALLKGSTLKVDDNAPAEIKRISMTDSLSGLQFGYAGDETLLLSGGGDGSTMWSIRGSEIRSTKLQMPKGVVGNTIVSTDGPWLVRAFGTNTDPGMLLEFDRETGALMAQINTDNVSGPSIFYERKNALYALWLQAGHPAIVSSD